MSYFYNEDNDDNFDYKVLFPYFLLIIIIIAIVKMFTEKIDIVYKVLLIAFFVYMFIFILKFMILNKYKPKLISYYDNKDSNKDPYDMRINYLPNRSQQISNIVKQSHEDFDENEFLGYVNSLYTSLILSKTTGNVDLVAAGLSSDMIDKFSAEFDSLKRNNLRNEIKDLYISQLYLTSYYQDSLKQSITVFIVLSCMDYIVDEENDTFLRGNRDYKLQKDYKLVFEYNKNIEDYKEVTCCPNCGAPLLNRYMNVCKYCNYTVPFKNSEWILCNIQPITLATADEQIIVNGKYINDKQPII